MRFPIRKIAAEEQAQFQQAMSVPFGNDPSPGWRERFRIAMEQADLYSAFDGDEMVSTFGSYRLDLTVPGGTQVPAAGTTVVTVLPTHRRQGILRSHMLEHFRDANEQGQVLAALWASESGIYGRFGYGPAAEAVRINLQKPHAKLLHPVDIRGRVRLVNAEEALARFPEVYDRVASERPGMFQRTPLWWSIRNLADPEELRRGATSHRRVLYHQGGEPAGYCIYRTKTNYENHATELQIIELLGVDAEAERGLWQFLFGVDLIAHITHWNLPVDDPLVWWLEQPRELRRTVSDSIWLRPVNVAEALNRRRYSAAGRLVFRFRDEYAPWNEGVYSLEADANGIGRCAKTTSSPELELTPFSLGSVYLGGHWLRSLAKAGLVSGSPAAIQTADALFAWPAQPWCQEILLRSGAAAG